MLILTPYKNRRLICIVLKDVQKSEDLNGPVF